MISVYAAGEIGIDTRVIWERVFERVSIGYTGVYIS
jgi:hypothetical protein